MAQHEAYQGLARKWRPQRFEDLVGQEAMTTALQNALRQNRLNHAHLLTGPRGIGKTTSARIIARALNCEQGPTPNPCGTCRHCIDTANGTDLDVIEIDAASNTGVDQMRELLERVVQSPFSARFKVYIIDEVHMLSTASFNALLKTLEEPPPHVIFIFATTEYEKVPETVRSRCVVHALRRLTAEDIIRRLTQVAEGEGIAIDPAAGREVFALIARAVEGGMRDALVIFDQLLALTDGKPTPEAAIQLLGLADHASLAQAVTWLAGGEAPPLLALVEELVDRGRSLERFVKSLIAYLRELMLLQAGADPKMIGLTGDALATARKQAGELAPATLFNVLNQIFELEQKLTTSTQARFLVEFTFLRLAAIQPVVPIDDVLRRLAAMPDAPSGGAAGGGGGGVPAGGTIAAAPPAAPRPATGATLPPLVRREAEAEPTPAPALARVEPLPAEPVALSPAQTAPASSPSPVQTAPRPASSESAQVAPARPAAVVDIFRARRQPALAEAEPAQAVMFDREARAGSPTPAQDPLCDLSPTELRGTLRTALEDHEYEEIEALLRGAEMRITTTTLRVTVADRLAPEEEALLRERLAKAVQLAGGSPRELQLESAPPADAADSDAPRPFYEDDATSAAPPEELLDDGLLPDPRPAYQGSRLAVRAEAPAMRGEQRAADPREADRRNPVQQVRDLLEQPDVQRRLRMIKDMFSGRFIDAEGRELRV